MKIRIILLILLLCGAWPLLAQWDSLEHNAPPPFVIDTIIVSGNEKTNTYVILDEMTLKSGSVVTPELIEFDKKRIYSLGLFTRVEIFADSLDGMAFLFVEVKERWYWIPLIDVGFRDGDPKKPYYGGGLLINNFRGRNQRVHGLLVFGYDPSVSLGFSDPLINRTPNLNFSGNLSFSRVRNKSRIESAITGDFDEEHLDINLTVGHRYTLFERVASTVGFTTVSVSEYRPSRTASPTGRDAFIYASLSYTNDTRDLHEYPSNGALVNLYVTKDGFGEGKVSFTKFGADLRKYIPLPLDFTLAGRINGTLLAGTFIPSYARTFIGYGERIRGYYSDVFEGENLASTTVELHWPLLKTRTFTFTAISIPEEFSVWQFGISLALFADAGVTWFRDRPIAFGSFASGYGGGIHFLLPYSIVLRAEYALNEYRHGQFILDFRTSI